MVNCVREDSTVLCAALGSGLGIAGLLTYNSGLFVNALGQEFGLTRTAYGAVFFGATLAMCVCDAARGDAPRQVRSSIDRAVGRRRARRRFCAALACSFRCWLCSASAIHRAVCGFILTDRAHARSGGEIPPRQRLCARPDAARHLPCGRADSSSHIGASCQPGLAKRIPDARSCWRYWGRCLLWDCQGVARSKRAPAIIRRRRFESFWGLQLFWIQLAAFASMALAFAGMLSHFVPMLVQERAADCQGRRIGRIDWGVSDCDTGPDWMALGSHGARLAGDCQLHGLCRRLHCVLALGGSGMAVVGVLALGAAIGAEADLIAILTARNFPLAIYGRAYSTQYAGFTIAAGISPLGLAMWPTLPAPIGVPLVICALQLVVSDWAVSGPFSGIRADRF